MGVVRDFDKVWARDLGCLRLLLPGGLRTTHEQRREYQYAGQHTDPDNGPEIILLHDTNGNYPDLDVKSGGGP
jgi:hypothetical protein